MELIAWLSPVSGSPRLGKDSHSWYDAASLN
jgi:hypothetical protein